MKAYVVGGAVRDRLLGDAVNDRDWVVVGATPQQMLAAGYTPVGRDFPVFLHPTTHEQYALARTERKAGRGYHGFVFHAAPDVTLQQDLARRDLTINAIAEDADTGELIDPFGGQRDIEHRVLRHVSDAFAEDPVRLLRLARFAARWPHFTVAGDTRALLRRLVDSGEVDALVPERVWQEVSRGLAEAKPSRMIELLRETGALARLAPALDACLADDARRAALLQALDAAPATPPAIRFACLCHGLDATGAPGSLPPLQALCERWRVDSDSRDLAVLVAREWPAISDSAELLPGKALALLERADAWRRPPRMTDAFAAWACLAAMLPPAARDALQPRIARLRRALQAAQAVSATALPEPLRQSADGPAIGRALRAARLRAISDQWLR
ncbi:MAG TPA: multifunctional CCA tRNA nucleotidyl transferase/2'3'-cyclic phosphodiesterase/2'nucleotidase/phosphatase [Burkholderiaceae bacterium]|nr:multifunctional CCA tRNA nucleotidyl transferase/2'3'-cyclic phosphodiesterase/2'nucleotidase/phosphatase [Burkholderiaceae bacterium]